MNTANALAANNNSSAETLAATAATGCRRGKIARLPAAIRRQLNLRLENNEPAETLLPWLNALEETKTTLAAQFAGAEITPQNLSEWRHGGFREWLLLQELMDHASRLHEGVHDLQAQYDPPALADNLATVLAARYAALLHSWDGEITPAFADKIKFLRDLTRDVTQLQKSLHRAAQQTRDLARQRQQDAADDLQAAKNAADARLMAKSRCRSLSNFTGGEVAHHRVAVEISASQSEIAAVLDRFFSESIQVNPTKIPPSPTSAASRPQ